MASKQILLQLQFLDLQCSKALSSFPAFWDRQEVAAAAAASQRVDSAEGEAGIFKEIVSCHG